MKLIVLVDNNTYVDQYYFGEPAVSYYIEDEDIKLLFDVRYSDVFIKNLHALGIQLESVSKIIISHGHDDHTRGLKYFFDQNYNNKISLIAHPEAFHAKVLDKLHIGSPFTTKELEKKCNLAFSSTPKLVSENIVFLGEIPQINNFERRVPIGKKNIDGELIDDFLLDDSALAYRSENGIFIITGCSHSGICNIVEYAKEICEDDRVLGIIGGFHLFELSEQLSETITYFKKNRIKELYPCHCTSFAVRAEIHKNLPVKEVGVGLELNW